MDIKGHYEYALVQKDQIPNGFLESGKNIWEYLYNGKIKSEILNTQNNLVSDQGLSRLNGQLPNQNFNSDSSVNIFLSPSIINGTLDYRRQLFSMGFVIDVTGLPINQVQTSTSWKGEFQFGAPLAPRTVRIIGIKFGSGLLPEDGSIYSFINLSTPITQTISTLFFVKYTLQGTYSSPVGIGGVSNAWVQSKVNNGIFNNHNLATIDVNHLQFAATRFLNAVDINKVGRAPINTLKSTGDIKGIYAVISKSFDPITYFVNGGSNVIFTPGDPFNNTPTGEIYTVRLQSSNTLPAGFSATIIYYITRIGNSDVRLSISIENAISGIYETPIDSGIGSHAMIPLNNPQFKKKALWTLGTSDFPGPHACSVAYTFDTINSECPVISVFNQDQTPTITNVFTHASGDDSVFSNPGLPPSSNGEIIISGVSTVTSIFKKLYAKITKTGEAKDIPDINTGEFKLATNLYAETETLGLTNLYHLKTIDCAHIRPLFLGNTIQDSSIDNWNNSPLTGFGSNTYKYRELKLSWAALITNGLNKHLYFCQEETQDNSNIGWICKWRFNTVEGSDSLIKLNSQNGAVSMGTNIWIATDTGLVKFDTTIVSPTLANSTVTYLISDGLLDDKVNDIFLDPITNMIWLGHDNGLTKINPTLILPIVSTHSIASTFSGVNALTTTQIKVLRGQLTAYNGIICWGGKQQNGGAYGPFDTDRDTPRIYDNNNGNWARVPLTGLMECNSVALVGDGTAAIIVDKSAINSQNFIIDIWDITLTDTIGSAAILINMRQTNTIVTSGTSGYQVASKIHRISVNHFTMLPVLDSYLVQFDYTINNNSLVFDITPGPVISVYFGHTQVVKHISSNMFEVDNVKLIWKYGYIVGTILDQEFGWTGSVWDRDSLFNRTIPNTVITTLDGIGFDFENASGFGPTEQFIAGENLMIVTGPGTIKTNLQTMSHKLLQFMSEITSGSTTFIGGIIPNIINPKLTVPESTLIDFVGIITDPSYTIVKIASVIATPSSLPGSGQYAVSDDGTFLFNQVDQGKTVTIDYYYSERH